MYDYETQGDLHLTPRPVFDPTTGKIDEGPTPQPATWEGSVLPALREALDAYPETRGCAVRYGGEDIENNRFIADIVLFDGTRCRTMRRDTAEHVRADAARVAFDMADIARMRRAGAAAKPPCPVCLAFAFWAPVCSSCRAKAAAAAELATWPEVSLETKSPPCATFSKAKDFLTTKWEDHEGRLRRSVWHERLATKYEVTRAIEPSDPCAPPAGFVFRRTEAGIAVYREGGPEFRMPNGLRSCTYWNARVNAQQIERMPATANDAPGRWDGCEEARDWAAWALGEA